MADAAKTAVFADGAGYEKFMGQWSRLAGKIILNWLSLNRGSKWLDVGCGTGAFTETIQEICAPAEIIGFDPSAEQVAYAQARNAANSVKFQVADAQSIPFDDDRFDVAVSALVLNFIPEREKAVGEMRRVVRSGGIVAAYVWDFAGSKGVLQHLDSAQRELAGAAYAPVGINNESSSLEKLKALFDAAGLSHVLTRPIDISVTFRDFDDYWKSNVDYTSPVSAGIKRLTDDQRQRLIDLVKAKLPIASNGNISYTARVNAVRGIV